MLRMMTAAVLCLASMPLAGCTETPPIDLCKGADVRRQVYRTTIAAAEAYAAPGRPVPQAVALGREAAATALLVLSAHCPEQLRAAH